jgi:hypothetical protein
MRPKRRASRPKTTVSLIRHFAVAGAFAAVASLSSPARACDCGGLSLEAAIDGAEAVVVARFVERIDHGGAAIEYRARVERALKGPAAGDVISLWDEGTSCDTIYEPWPGARLFFARRAGGHLVPDVCSQYSFPYTLDLDARVAAIAAVTRESAIAEPPHAPEVTEAEPTTPDSETAASTCSAGRTPGLDFSLLVVAPVIAAARRRHRSRRRAR